jgi:hypothetical protein
MSDGAAHLILQRPCPVFYVRKKHLGLPKICCSEPCGGNPESFKKHGQYGLSRRWGVENCCQQVVVVIVVVTTIAFSLAVSFPDGPFASRGRGAVALVCARGGRILCQCHPDISHEQGYFSAGLRGSHAATGVSFHAARRVEQFIPWVGTAVAAKIYFHFAHVWYGRPGLRGYSLLACLSACFF